MADASKRIEMLEKMVGSGKADAFGYYALGLEYRRAARVEDALATFGKLREQDPSYLPMYLMAGQILIEQGRKDEAAEWLRAGIALAVSKGDSKTLSELEAALAET